MRQIVFNAPVINQWVKNSRQVSFDPEMDVTIGTVNKYWQPLGVCVIKEYTGASVMLHMAARDSNWMTRDLVIAVFHYIFVQLGCNSAFAIADETNTTSLDIMRRLRFKEVASLPGMFAASDGVMLRLSRDDCRWWKLPLRTLRSGQ